MNYRHAYHAGNFADVLKHVILARILTYLKLKPAPFRIIDTHAGAGRYDLGGAEACKTGEWRDGVARIFQKAAPVEIADLLAPYVSAVQNINPVAGELSFYPGSPLIALAMMRPDDYLVANELHPDDSERLKSEIKGVRNAKAMSLDAYQAVKALLPPTERRGVVLIDPPFEQPSEFSRLVRALDDGLRRFETGVFMVWYPVKDQGAADRFVAHAAKQPGRKFLDARLAISAPFAGLGLTETGVLVINPPFTLYDDLSRLMPWLLTMLAHGAGAGWRLDDGRC